MSSGPKGKLSISHAVLLGVSLVVLPIAGVAADLCAAGHQEIDGNWFCQPVNAIQYSNVGRAGAYQDVVNMAPDGTCSQQPKAFSGPIAPLDEELSVHFRGPIHLKQFAAYTPTSAAANRRGHARANSRQSHQHRHIHGGPHRKRKLLRGLNGDKVIDERGMVTATINGQVVSWSENWLASASVVHPATNAQAALEVTVAHLNQEWITATINNQVVSWTNEQPVLSVEGTVAPGTPPLTTQFAAAGQLVTAKPGPVSTSSPVVSAARISGNPAPVAKPSGNEPAAFERISYYHSKSQTADNVVFLGNLGGHGSGVFDNKYGSSASYVNSTATGCAASPQTLHDAMMPSDVEVAIFTAEHCNGDCGYVRPGSVAHKGFKGADKVFLFEFQMPRDGSAAFNGDMPAVWALNAKIFRTLQYGPATCSCWETGCGEFDIAETLTAGSDFMKSTLHTNAPGGDSDYFVRPVNQAMKMGVVFSSASATICIQVLSNDVDFGSSLSANDITKMCETQAGLSHFQIA